MNRIQIAKQLHRLMEFQSAGLPDEQAAQLPLVFPAWRVDTTYAAGDRVRSGEKLYKCLTGHRAQEDWPPPEAPSLWVQVDDPAEEWPQWRQPQTAEEAYARGAQVRYQERRWISEQDGNVWVPGEYGWTEAR